MVVPACAYRRSRGAARRHLEDRLHEGAQTVDGPHVDVIDILEMVHISDDHRVYVLDGQLCVIEGAGDRFTYEFYARCIQALRRVMGLPDSDDSYSFTHNCATPLFAQYPDTVRLPAHAVYSMYQRRLRILQLPILGLAPQLQRAFGHCREAGHLNRV